MLRKCLQLSSMCDYEKVGMKNIGLYHIKNVSPVQRLYSVVKIDFSSVFTSHSIHRRVLMEGELVIKL